VRDHDARSRARLHPTFHRTYLVLQRRHPRSTNRDDARVHRVGEQQRRV
jgi:hypothetical protein